MSQKNTSNIIEAPAGSIKAQLVIAYSMLVLFLIHIVEAYITYPFVDYTTKFQNVVYGFGIGSPYLIICIVFIILRTRDLAALKE
jgi:hypothetical protein